MFIENKRIFLLLTFLVLLVYINGLFNDFVSDDKGIVLNSNDLVYYTFSQPFAFLKHLVYLIANTIGGTNPWIFRLPNILFHIGTTWLIFLLASLFANKRVALIASLLFAVHPINVESITWISGGVYVQYSFFFLLSFLFYVLQKKKLFIFSLLAFLAGLLTSEKAVVLPLVLFTYEFVGGTVRKHWKRLAPFFAMSAIYTLLYIGRIGHRVETLQSSGSMSPGMDSPFLQIPFAITNYLELLLWPNALTLYHSELAISQEEYIVRLIVFLILVGFLIYSFFKKKQLFFWMAFFIISLLPTLTPFRISWIVAERYVYLGTVGIFFLVALGFAKLLELKQLRPTLVIILSIIIVSLSVRTIVRNIDWKNEDNLWVATGKTSPSSPNTHNNLGDVYGRWGDLKKSESEFREAIKIKPDYADAYHNLGNVLRQQKRNDEALVSYQKALEFNPTIWQSYVNIGALYFEKGEYQKSLESVDKAIKLLPNNPDLYISKGIIYVKMGEKEKAREQFQLILNADPTNQNAQAGMVEVEKMK